MADMTLCGGDGCDKKDTCYRYLAKSEAIHQSYFFIDAPNDCKHYIDVRIKGREWWGV